MIREATVQDSGRIAEIDVISSRYAYHHIVSDECLYKDLTVENRIPVHSRWITEKRFDIYVYEDEDLTDAFELHYLYVDPDFVRTGIGSEMLRFFEQKGMDRGCRELVIWVLEENKMARAFYEKNHYRPDGKEKIFKRWNKREIRYRKG